ncbi:MAG: hypothetical protein QOI20_862 [Acidimicrobiaceae bacterium]|nr:hypothetical protein [Acidimicrobiaceae bacterium]
MADARVLAGDLTVAALLAFGTTPAHAETAAEVRTLARRAHTDPAARERLRAVHDVDGTPADFDTALGQASGADLDHRLDVIESSAGAQDPGSAASALAGRGPQQAASRILHGRRFRPATPPRPLRGAVHRLGQWLEPVVAPLGRWLAPVGRVLRGVFRNAVATGMLGAAVVGLAAVVAVAAVNRRSRLDVNRVDDEEGGIGSRRADPKELERQADAAEAAGSYDRAFRLRFQAGVIRLDRAGLIADRPSATTGQLVKTVRSAAFPDLARTFDEIAYGGRPSGPEDVARAKQTWPRVLEEARR